MCLHPQFYLRRFGRQYPQAELHYMIYPHTQPVIKNNPFIDQLVLYDPEKQGGFSGFFSFLKKIKKQKYDVVIDVYSKIGSGIFSFGSGAKIRIAYRKWYTKFLYTDTFNYKIKLKQTPAWLSKTGCSCCRGFLSIFLRK